MFAVWRVGAINVPLNIFLRGQSLAYQLGDSEPRVVVADAQGVAALSECIGQVPGIEQVVTVDPPGPSSSDSTLGVRTDYIEDFVGSVENVGGRSIAAEISDCASILYTSGTTGPPKGCVMSHRYVRHWGHALASFVQPSTEPVILTSTPLNHVMGNLALSLAVEHGGTLVLEPNFRASTFFRRAGEVGATMAFGIGWLGKALLGQPESDSDRQHRLRTIYMSPVSEEDRDRFFERFGVEVHAEIYGQTECVPLSFNPPGTLEGRGSLGKPCACLELDILDDDGFSVPPGGVGEIVARPRHPGAMFDGYWRDSTKTLESFENLWHHTGDLGRVDESGHYYYVDRKKDSMRRRGENVSAHEVEMAISQHPAIAEVAVHGVRLESEVDDAIKACVVLKAGHELPLDEFAPFLAKELPYFAVPRFVEILEELPKNPVGRIMKDVLRERAQTPQTLDLEQLGFGVPPEKRRGTA
jgi:crotonobetaine/carnitine-CoA ligase